MIGEKESLKGAESQNLDINFSNPNTDHDSSDHCGDAILGKEDSPFWKDHKASKINRIRTETHLRNADVVIVKFGEKYRQWNAAYEAGMASALQIPYIVIHPEEFTHALKEVDADAKAVCQNAEEALEILEYCFSKA